MPATGTASATNHGDLLAKITWCDSGTKVVVARNHSLVLIKVYSLRYNPCLTLLSDQESE